LHSDGYLTCSASSSGGGCSVAAYDWLDNAIGSDTGSSMRRPAAVSGTYGNRPSQGMIVLDGAIPLSYPSDTAGVFSRNPHQWVKFAKAWYAPSLHQGSSITGLPNLDIKDTKKFPKRILYPVEYLPLANPAAQKILEGFLGKVTDIFGMKIEHTNFTATVKNATIYPDVVPSTNFAFMGIASSVFSGWTQQLAVSGPLIKAWGTLFGGRFPPVDPQWRTSWLAYNASATNPTTYAAGLKTKATAVAWFEKNILFETQASCSEAMLICDIGTGGLPSFREQDLNVAPNATLLAALPVGAALTCANICPSFA
jgi:Asp-tRNA(Asn)/Glu-tRNA(Gln) amidotransferase A subunit family amidase